MDDNTSTSFRDSSSSLLFVESSIALKIGLKEAMILEQIHCWLETGQNSKLKNGTYWVSKTYKQWKVLFPFWSARTIQRAISNLEEKGFLESHLSGGYHSLKYYTINYDTLRKLDIELCGFF